MALIFKNLSNLLSLKYWFTLNPEPFLGNISKVLYIFFILLFTFAFAAKVLIKKYKNNPPLRNIWNRFYYFFATYGILGILFVFFRDQRIYFLGAHFWLLLLFLSALLWFFFIIRYIKIKIPKLKEEIELKKEMEKYLPK